MREESAVDKYIRLNPRTGFFEPVWWRREVMPYWLGPDPQFSSNGVITINSFGTPTPPVSYKLPHTSLSMDGGVGNPLLINQLVADRNSEAFDAQGAADFSVMMKDLGDQTQFMNAPIHALTLFGSSQESARLSEPLFLPTRHNLLLSPYGNATLDAPTDFRMQFLGQLYDTWATALQSRPEDHREIVNEVNYWLERRKYVFPFWLTTDGGVVTVPANQTVEATASIGSDAAFEATHILTNNYVQDGQVVSTQEYEVEFFNTQTRQTLMNGRIHSAMIGNAEYPQPLPASFVVPAGEIISFRIKDLSGGDNLVYLTLRGRKIRAPFTDREGAAKILGIPYQGKPTAKGGVASSVRNREFNSSMAKA